MEPKDIPWASEAVKNRVMAEARRLCAWKTAEKLEDHWTRGTPNSCLNCVIETALKMGQDSALGTTGTS